jgi:hypothetical protein
MAPRKPAPEPAFPSFVKTWWPVVTAIIVISGLMSSALSYYAKVEAKELIKAEMTGAFDKIIEQQQKLENEINQMHMNQIESKTKVDLMLDLMQKNNKLLDQQQKAIEELPKK